MKVLSSILSVTLFLSHIAFGQWTQASTRYVHPHQALYKLKLAETTEPFLKYIQEDIKDVLETFSSPEQIIQPFSLPNITLPNTTISDTCANQLGYLMEAIIDSSLNNTWALKGKLSLNIGAQLPSMFAVSAVHSALYLTCLSSMMLL